MANGMGLVRRAWLLIAITTSVVLVPRLFDRTDVPASGHEVEVITTRATVGDAESDVIGSTPPEGWAAAALVAATSDPATTSSTTTTAAAIETTTTTVAPPPQPTTTTTAPPPPPPAPTTTTTSPPPASSTANAEEGEASWYDIEGSEPGVCAHRTLAFGTVLRVTNLENGRSTTCTVGDRGPFVEGRILDLHKEDFAKLAPLSEGVIQVRIEW